MLDATQAQELIAATLDKFPIIAERSRAEARELIRYTADGAFERTQYWRMQLDRPSKPTGYKLEIEIEMSCPTAERVIDDSGNRVALEKPSASVRTSVWGSLTIDDAKLYAQMILTACSVADELTAALAPGVKRVIASRAQIEAEARERASRELKAALVSAGAGRPSLEMLMKCARAGVMKSIVTADAALAAAIKSADAAGRVEFFHTVGNGSSRKTYRVNASVVTSRTKSSATECVEVMITRTV